MCNFMNRPEKLSLAINGDERGKLVAVESGKDVPFEMKRIFYIYGTEQGVVRGCHANRKSEFVLINLVGSCKILVDDGKGTKNVYNLEGPGNGLYIPRMYWREMYDFSPDCMMLVLANEHYDMAEYIRDYDEFINIINERKE